MNNIAALDNLRKLAIDFRSDVYKRDEADYVLEIVDEIEREISERYVPKNNAEIDKTAVQEYNLTVHVADGQTIEYNTELRHRRGAATSMSVAFRLE